MFDPFWSRAYTHFYWIHCHVLKSSRCLLWYDLTTLELLKLERSHTIGENTNWQTCFAHRMTFDRSDDKQTKLHFFGRLCRLIAVYCQKIVRTMRLFEFTHKCVGTQKGFISDLMCKYNIETQIKNYVKHSIFSFRKPWASILKDAIVKVD